MNRKVFHRLLVLIFVALSCAILISYKQAKSTTVNQECTSGEKCEQKKAQTDLILLESISKHLLSASDN